MKQDLLWYDPEYRKHKRLKKWERHKINKEESELEREFREKLKD